MRQLRGETGKRRGGGGGGEGEGLKWSFGDPFVELKDLKDREGEGRNVIDVLFECHRLIISGKLELFLGSSWSYSNLESKNAKKGKCARHGSSSSRWKLKVKLKIELLRRVMVVDLEWISLLPSFLALYTLKNHTFRLFHGPIDVGSISGLIWLGPRQSPKIYVWVGQLCL